MKFNCGPTPQEKHEAKQDWHPWFAWCPVRVGSGDCRWLETVERKGTCNFDCYGDWFDWEYRPIKGK
jgi:hypothetical protein